MKGGEVTEGITIGIQNTPKMNPFTNRSNAYCPCGRFFSTQMAKK